MAGFGLDEGETRATSRFPRDAHLPDPESVARTTFNVTGRRTPRCRNNGGRTAGGDRGHGARTGRRRASTPNTAWNYTGTAPGGGRFLSSPSGHRERTGRDADRHGRRQRHASQQQLSGGGDAGGRPDARGRAASSAPFPIGATCAAHPMPANGTLLLGVNDDATADNSGFFSVVVTRTVARRKSLAVPRAATQRPIQPGAVDTRKRHRKPLRQ